MVLLLASLLAYDEERVFLYLSTPSVDYEGICVRKRGEVCEGVCGVGGGKDGGV